MAAVWDSDLSDIYEVVVLLALADHADDDGRCLPSIARIARRARCSERKAQAVIQGLAKRGLPRIQLNDGPRGCNIFWIVPPPAHDAPPHTMHPRTACTPARRDRDPRTPRPLPPHGVHPNHQETPRNRQWRNMVFQRIGSHQRNSLDGRNSLGSCPLISVASWSCVLCTIKPRGPPWSTQKPPLGLG